MKNIKNLYYFQQLKSEKWKGYVGEFTINYKEPHNQIKGGIEKSINGETIPKLIEKIEEFLNVTLSKNDYVIE